MRLSYLTVAFHGTAELISSCASMWLHAALFSLDICMQCSCVCLMLTQGLIPRVPLSKQNKKTNLAKGGSGK